MGAVDDSQSNQRQRDSVDQLYRAWPLGDPVHPQTSSMVTVGLRREIAAYASLHPSNLGCKRCVMLATALPRLAKRKRDMTSNWLTVSDIAATLNISSSSVYNLVDSGAIVSHRFGCGRGAIRVSRENFDRFIEEAEEPVRQLSTPRRDSVRSVLPGGFKHLDVSRVLPSKKRR